MKSDTGWPDVRDYFKQLDKEAATRPRNEALEKHGAEIESAILTWPKARESDERAGKQEPEMECDR